MVFLATLTLTMGFQIAPVVQEQPPATVTRTARFELRSDSRVALHHFLIDWAATDAGEWPRFALPLAERDDWRKVLDPSEQRVWASAVETYAVAVGRSVVFDEGLQAVRDWAVGVTAGHAIPTSEQPLADALVTALPVYERHWWQAHHERNREWVASVVPQLVIVEDDMIARFETAYGGRWPDARIPVDVMVYANAVGAYSTGGRLTISSMHRGNQMPQALEMIFHEASHTDEMELPLRAGVRDAFRAAGGEAPDRFWHDMIFYTSGDITRLVLAERGQTDYQHYGSFGLYRRGERWVLELPALEQHWRPFLESQRTENDARHEALRAVAAQLLRPE